MVQRIRSVDQYIENLFGKPDYSKSFENLSLVFTPMGNGHVKIWRVDNRKGLK